MRNTNFFRNRCLVIILILLLYGRIFVAQFLNSLSSTILDFAVRLVVLTYLYVDSRHLFPRRHALAAIEGGIDTTMT